MTLNKFNVRIGLVDGLPTSYDTSHVLLKKYTCGLCEKKFTRTDIDGNKLLYTDEFEFCHKTCISENKIEYQHMRPKDLSSPITLVKKKTKNNKAVKYAKKVKNVS